MKRGSPRMRLPEAEAERQDVQGVESLILHGLDDGLGLVDREPAVELVLGRGGLDELGDFGRDDVLSYGGCEMSRNVRFELSSAGFLYCRGSVQAATAT